MKEKIGIIGVGIMGKLMATHLIEAGYDVAATVYTDAEREFCKNNNVEIAETRTDLLKLSKRILCSLPSPVISKSIAKEIVDATTPEHIIMDTSTMLPEDQTEIEEIYKKSGATYVEGGILGRATNCGKWVMIAGGGEDAIKIMEPICLPFCEKVVRAGGIGAASTIKVLNNTMFCIFNTAVCEVFVMAEKANVELKALYDIIANSQAGTNCGVFREIGNRIVEGRYDEPNATVQIGVKDNGCGKHIARTVGMSPTLTTDSLMAFENAASFGLANEDTAALYKYFQHVYQKNQN
ncbi:hypothetical protein AN639_07210 [Candidatus Epulonipiscium fishelsonii]|uniref:Uncharacterized protein n=1 Tax=Candidatus Epulonipiscium fishelsonii TaxID=77094 RepID=A0ACC8X9J8_9FIRM|nr:hypothetical protein AN639_07210 [Epulopiscium sp. SCG-B05WGA-EpuloA1]ONI39039.1 hypothetical protein AN396_09190 [Epulopiscium sp. SCG-B11WGA-EpuloA1]